MPRNSEEVEELASAIQSDKMGDWGATTDWPAERMAQGDWRAAQWYDGGLAESALSVEDSERLVRCGYHYRTAAAGRAVRDVFDIKDDVGKHPQSVKVFWSIANESRKTMQGSPEKWVRPSPGKEQQARGLLSQGGRLLVADRYDTHSGRITALWTRELSIGSRWVPLVPLNGQEDQRREKALVAWWNSTPVRLMLLNRRSRKLTYPSWSVKHLLEIMIPKPDNPAWDALADAFAAHANTTMLPYREAPTSPAQIAIDEAAALALDLPNSTMQQWRERLAAEPTITARPAPA